MRDPESRSEPAAHDKPAKPKTGARDRLRPLRVIVSDDERTEITRLAKLTGHSISSYLRTVGLGAEVRSTVDHQAVLDLAKVAADLGRYGGLLKLWLTEKRGQGADVADVNAALRHSRDVLAQLRERIGKI